MLTGALIFVVIEFMLKSDYLTGDLVEINNIATLTYYCTMRVKYVLFASNFFVFWVCIYFWKYLVDNMKSVVLVDSGIGLLVSPMTNKRSSWRVLNQQHATSKFIHNFQMRDPE